MSELTKPAGDGRVVRWIEAQGEDDLFLSVVTVAEVRYGIERMSHGKRRGELEDWLQEELVPRFESRLLAVTVDVANACGVVVALADASGRPMKAMDGLIAATAGVHSLELATRNVADFELVLDRVTNPWSADS